MAHQYTDRETTISTGVKGRKLVIRSFAVGLLLSTAVMGHVRSSYAQAAPFATSTNYALPSQALSVSLVKFSELSGSELFVQATLLKGKAAPALHGAFTLSEALNILLSSSGLRYQIKGNTVTIFAAESGDTGAAAGTTRLQEIVVEGKGGRLGPVSGYVASNGSAGSKISTPLMKTPQSVTVVTREQASAQGAQSVVQSLRYTAGVAAEVRGTATRYDLPYIRGFGSPTDSNQYVDGLRNLRGGGYVIPQIEAYGIERVEFLKGPSSTLYGGVNPGGMINVASKMPTDVPQREVELQFGSHTRAQVGLDFSGPVADNHSILYRVVALGKKGDTAVVNTKEERHYIAPSITFAPDSDTSLTVSGLYQHDPEGGFYGVLPTVGTVWKGAAGQIPRNFNDGDSAYDAFDRTQASIGYNFEHRFNDTWSMRHNLRYIDLTTMTKSVGTLSMAADDHTINRYALGTDEALHGLTSDLQFQAEFDTGALKHTALFGYDYQYSNWRQMREMDRTSVPSQDFLNPVDGVATNLNLLPITDQKQTLRQSGYYLQDQIEFERWTLVAGGRYDSIRTTTDDYLNSKLQIQNDSAFSGKLGLLYSFDNGVSPYVSYSTSFLPVSGLDSNNVAFKPTKARQIELGVKYQPAGFDGLFTLAYFDINQTNIVTTASPVSSYQTGEQSSRGIEFEAKAAVNDNINMTAAFSYTKADVVKGLGADEGNYPIGVPDYTASLWADYSFTDDTFNGLNIGAGIRYVGKTVGGYTPNASTAGATKITASGYTLVDAALTYDFGKKSPELNGLSGKLAVNNLFDETYATCLSNNFCNYGNGRVITGTLTYKW